MAFGSIGSFFENLGGPKMRDADKYHDPKELKKWKDRSEKTYGMFGKRREKYSGRADKEYGRYGRSRSEAQRLYGRMEGATGEAQAAVGQAALRERRAGELADDRQHYAGLRDRAADRRRQRQGYRLELEAKAREGGTFDAVQSMVMDAAKMGNDAAMAQTEGIAAGLAKTNPVAAAKLLLDANQNAASNLGKAKQQGWFTGKDQQLRQFAVDAQRIGQQAAMLGDDEQADRYLSEARGQQIQEQMGLSAAALNRSAAGLNVASSYGQQGQMQAQLASQAAGMSQRYDAMGNQMLTEEASIQEQRMGREQELLLSDRMAQQQVDEYNQGRMGRGSQTGLQIAGTAASMYSGISAGMASNAQADLYSKQAAQIGAQTFADSQIQKRGPRFVSDVETHPSLRRGTPSLYSSNKPLAQRRFRDNTYSRSMAGGPPQGHGGTPPTFQGNWSQSSPTFQGNFSQEGTSPTQGYNRQSYQESMVPSNYSGQYLSPGNPFRPSRFQKKNQFSNSMTGAGYNKGWTDEKSLWERRKRGIGFSKNRIGPGGGRLSGKLRFKGGPKNAYGF